MAHKDVAEPIDRLVVDYWAARQAGYPPAAALVVGRELLFDHEVDRAMCYVVDMCEDDGRILFEQDDLAWMRLQAFGPDGPLAPLPG